VKEENVIIAEDEVGTEAKVKVKKVNNVENK